ncbi:MAG: DMT family transporter [Firmicutes bacterium]|nr:DMT family transporter [Bacillota bacterium]
MHARAAWPGALLAALSASAFALLPIFARIAYAGGASVTTALFLRFTGAAALFFAIGRLRAFTARRNAAHMGARPPAAPQTARAPRPAARRAGSRLLLLAGVLYAAQSILYFSAVRAIPASLAALLLYLYPVLVALLDVRFGGRRLDRRLVAALALALAGLALVLGAPRGARLDGVLLAFGAAVVFSTYVLVSDRALRAVDPLDAATVIAAASAAASLAAAAASSTLTPALDAPAWWAVAALAVVCTGLAWPAFLTSVRWIGPTRASVISTVEPPVTTLAAALVFGERIGAAQAAGGVLILAGAVLATLAGGADAAAYVPAATSASERRVSRSQT